MGISTAIGGAFAKGQLAAAQMIPAGGCVFVSVRDQDKSRVIPVVQQLLQCEFEVVATAGTATFLQQAGLQVKKVNKVHEGRPHIVDYIKNKQIDFIINTTAGAQAVDDSKMIRRSAVAAQVCYVTTLAGAEAACRGMLYAPELAVCSVQQWHLYAI